MHITHNILIDCSSSLDSLDCHARCVAGLGSGPGFKLEADEPDDVVNGAVSISHGLTPKEHQIMIEMYDDEESPNGGHRSTLRPPVPCPTEEELIQRLVTYLEEN